MVNVNHHDAQDVQTETFRVSLGTTEVIESAAGVVRVLEGRTLGLLALYKFATEPPVLEVYPTDPIADEDVSLFCYRVAWLALYGAQAGTQRQPDQGDEPTIDVVVPTADPHLTLPRMRSAIYQLYQLASGSPWPVFPRIPAQTKTYQLISHPLRGPLPPRSPGGPWLYSRWIPHLSHFFALRSVTEDDVHLLHGWLNSPRVDRWWKEASDQIETHRTFITSRIDDPHTEPVIGSYVDRHGNAQPAIYCDLYWAKEDRLGEFYEADDYDRGLHVFVGSEFHRGSDYLRAWLPSVLHYMFLSDPRTMRLVAEPNSLNVEMASIFSHFAGMEQKKTFHFPHKEAALMMVTRDAFFEGPYL